MNTLFLLSHWCLKHRESKYIPVFHSYLGAVEPPYYIPNPKVVRQDYEFDHRGWPKILHTDERSYLLHACAVRLPKEKNEKGVPDIQGEVFFDPSILFSTKRNYDRLNKARLQRSGEDKRGGGILYYTVPPIRSFSSNEVVFSLYRTAIIILLHAKYSDHLHKTPAWYQFSSSDRC